MIKILIILALLSAMGIFPVEKWEKNQKFKYFDIFSHRKWDIWQE